MEIQGLIEELNGVYKVILDGSQKVTSLENIHSDYELSAKNLFHYLLFRSFDLRKYHDTLSELGLSSLRTSEGYVLANLRNVLGILKQKEYKKWEIKEEAETLGYRKSKDLLDKHTWNLFGESEVPYLTKIMVTLPTEAAYDKKMVYDMARNGMRVARINLGHDSEEVWKLMIDRIRKAEKKMGASIKIYMDLAGPKIRTSSIGVSNGKPKKKKSIPIQKGECIVLTKTPETLKKSKFDKKGQQLTKAILGVSLPQIIDDVQVGDAVLFDDGMVRSRVVSKTKRDVELEITNCFKAKIGAEKGINLPNTKLNLPALTEKDLEALPFACQYADIIGYSFVKNEEDVQKLYHELDVLQADDIGVVFKIENQEAFENFPDILFKAMERNKIGVMIARGDLAVEIGFERIAEVQKELMWICEAAHVPVIWATQVLETLAKKGIPTRAEISDAAEGARAECVMLNKGPHILEAIAILRNILDRMDGHMSKKKASLRALSVANNFLDKTKNLETA